MAKKSYQPPPLETRHFTSTEEINSAIMKIKKRITEVEALDPTRIKYDDTQIDVVESNITNTIREIFGENSPECRELGHIRIWKGGYAVDEPDYVSQGKFTDGIPHVLTILRGLISRLEEKREDLGGLQISPTDFWTDVHPKITAVARSRYETDHYADAVEAALKEINSVVKDIVKRKTGTELDGASLMRTALSPNSPIICLDDLSTETGKNVQQGYMEIFAGAMIGIRNPKAHDNIKITENRARHFIYLSSLLMHKIDERI